MQIKTIFELSMTLDTEKFYEIYEPDYDDYDYPENDEWVDRSLESKGLVVLYRDSQYKKKVKLLVDTSVYDTADMSAFIKKLDKRVTEYFDSRYHLKDFIVSGIHLSVNLDVGGAEQVMDYLRVIQRIGKVKGFSPVSYDWFDEENSFCLRGNTNAEEFYVYDLEQTIMNNANEEQISRSQLKEMRKETKGILRTEVRLTKLKSIRCYTEEENPGRQMAELYKQRQKIYMDTITKIIPYGDFYKKEDAVEILRREVKDNVMRRKMLRMVALIPDKKSLHLAQKEMQCRTMDEVMAMFAKINLSPVTISKRHDVKHLKNIYTYLVI